MVEYTEGQRQSKRNYYLRNKQRVHENADKRKAEIRAWIKRYKAANPCVLCGESHPACLSFHHENENEKEMTIAQMVVKGYGITKIEAEIAKCQVLCHNCHAKLHWSKFFESL